MSLPKRCNVPTKGANKTAKNYATKQRKTTAVRCSAAAAGLRPYLLLHSGAWRELHAMATGVDESGASGLQHLNSKAARAAFAALTKARRPARASPSFKSSTIYKWCLRKIVLASDSLRHPLRYE